MTEENVNMGREAFRIYDEQGEEAMLAYLIAHEKPGGQADEWTYNLEDGSQVDINLGPGGYYALIGEDGEPERPANVNDIPPYFDRGTPMLPWPNSGSLMDALLELIAEATMAGYGMEPDDINWARLDLYQALTAAPGLPRAIRSAMTEVAESSPRERTLAMLGDMQSECVELALELLPEEEVEELEKRAKTIAGQQGGNGETSPG